MSLTILQSLAQGTWGLEAQEGSHLDLCHASENAWDRKRGEGCYPPYLGPEHCALKPHCPAVGCWPTARPAKRTREVKSVSDVAS